MQKAMTPTKAAYEKILALGRFTQVCSYKPPQDEPTYNRVVFMYVIWDIGKIKTRLASHSMGGSRYIMVNNKDIGTMQDWAEARDRWSKEKMWKELTKNENDIRKIL